MTDASIDALLARVRTQTTARDVRPIAIHAIRTLEAALLEALNARELTGMPNLGSREAPLYGARVRDQRYQERITFGSAPVLILLPSGALAMAHFVDVSNGGDSEWHPVVVNATDDKLLIEDVEHLQRTVPSVIFTHLQKSERSSTSFAALHNIAQRILDTFS